MNKILIVGHKESHYQALDKILQGCGMAPALPSHTHRLGALQITDKLLHVAKPTGTQKQIAHSAESKSKKNVTTPIAPQVSFLNPKLLNQRS